MKYATLQFQTFCVLKKRTKITDTVHRKGFDRLKYIAEIEVILMNCMTDIGVLDGHHNQGGV